MSVVKYSELDDFPVGLRLFQDTVNRMLDQNARPWVPAVDKGYQRVERSYGTFARYFTLPETVDSERVRADYSAGVLTVTLPKKEVAKPRSIKVQVSNN